ncbi:MAG: 50S ribosomal protein L7/L12 [Mycoplasmataceae bacterium]|nr:50S ribosomal protein L7/L12 [Mycoplasmataceae bacterium]
MALKVENFIKELKEMKVVELNELVKAIEKEFGVTAAAPQAAISNDASSASTEVNVKLVSAGGNKIAVIKIVKEIMGLALMEAKTFAENGGIIKESISPEEASSLAAKFKEVGAEVVVE